MNTRIKELYQLVEKYNDAYYNNNTSLVDDYTYDALISELKELETSSSDNIPLDSPLLKVGGAVDDRFKKETHNHPMLSLDNVFSKEDFIEFDRKVNSELGGLDYSYVCELKIDGLAMSLTYDKVLVKAVTRGDGLVGENVLHNIKTIGTLPKDIGLNEFEVRGEVFIDKKEFMDINKRENKSFANPRNLAAGTVRQLDSTITQKRKLDMFVYGLVEPSKYNMTDYFSSMLFLKELGFKTNEKIRLCNNVEEVNDYIDEITNIRENLDYEIDGIVIKVNEYEHQSKLGYTAKYPKWATAYKFKSSEVTSKLNNIFLTVGRTGKITPNAEIEPVYLMGSTISRATLHNLNYIIEKDIRIGDEVIVIKAGDVIPRVEGVDKSKRKDQKIYELPSECPVCLEPLTLIDSEHYCNNIQCPGRQYENLCHFVSRDALNIDGLGKKIIEKLIENGLITKYSDIFNISKEQLLSLEGFKDKSVDNILESINNSKNVRPENFLFALGIKNVGLTVAKQIIKSIISFDDLFSITVFELSSIDGIGDTIANSIVNYFSDSSNIEQIKYVREKGVKLEIEKNVINVQSHYFGKSIVITGSFDKYKRSDIKANLEQDGAKIVGSISKNTDFLFVGDKAGSKLSKAIELDVTIVDKEKVDEYMGVSK